MISGLVMWTVAGWLVAAPEQPPAPAVKPATLQRVLLAKPAIAHPDHPFVHVFFEGGDDRSRYGFTLDGTMTAEDWAAVLSHVGYLCPYSDFKPGVPETWRTHRRDIAVRGGQLVGRQTGGCVMGLGEVKAAYAEPLALGMTHFFHDWEGDLGTPGGTGVWRLRTNHAEAGSLATDPVADFDTRPGRPMAAFTIEFGCYLQHYLFGGQARLLDCRDDGGDRAAGWAIGVVNKGGHKGSTHLYFESGGKRLESVPLANWQTWNWQDARFEVSAVGPDEVAARIVVAGLGETSGTLPRPQLTAGRLRLVAGTPPQDERLTDLDDLRLTSGAGELLARYAFEPMPGDARAFGQPVEREPDLSGRGHDLRPVGEAGAFSYAGVDGVDPAVLAAVKQYLVDDLLEVRRQHGAPPPELITNWSLSNRPGRFAVWRQVGFTAGNTDHYLYGDMEPGFANLHRVLHSRRTRWADADGSRWSAVWLGQVNSKVPLSVSQWQSLVTLSVLDGNRWLLLFPAMSQGHFAAIDEPDRARLATVNAEVLHACAETASWFQSSAAGLAGSEAVATGYALDDPRLAVRLRVNQETGEAWFAAMRIGIGETPAAVALTLPRASGQVTNLATGWTARVEQGQFSLPLTAAAQPHYFQP